jgi:WD40-like Beta Propeller Repeat
MMRSAVVSFGALLVFSACGGKADLANGDGAETGGAAGSTGGGTGGTGGSVGGIGAGVGGSFGGVGGVGAGVGGSLGSVGGSSGGTNVTTGGGPAASVPDAAAPAACAAADLAARFIVFDSNRTDMQWDIFKMRADGTDVTTLVGGTADEREPAVSPDGMRLAYVSNQDGTYQVMVRDLAAGTDTKITSLPKGARQPSWSSDSQRIVFVTDEGAYTGTEAGSVYVVQAEQGAQPELVLAGGFDGYMQAWHYPSFGPGDASIITSTGTSLVEAFFDGRPNRDIVPITGRIPNPDEATLSPDGRLVAFVDNCGAPSVWQLYMVRFDGTTGDTCQNGAQLTNLDFWPHQPAWGPPGYIAFDGGNTVTDVYLLALGDGTSAPAVCNLTNAHSLNRNPSWVP